MNQATETRRRIIPAEKMGFVVEAITLLDQAAREHAGASEAVRQAVEEARKDAYRAALDEARLLFAEHFRAALMKVEAALLAFDEPLAELIKDTVAKLINVIPEPERTRRLVQRALRDLDYPGPVTLHVPMQAEGPLRDGFDGFRVTVLADPLLKPEELVIEARGGRMHIGLPSQLARIDEMLSHG